MTNQEDFYKITPSSNYSAQIKQFENNLLEFMNQYGLPTDSVLVTVSERLKVFKNIEDVVEKIEDNKKERSFYISKFIAASAAGLFDAALNYLWDETISELRIRVEKYDLDYFFDTAVGASSERRKKLKDKDDLVNISDSELIKAANEIELISDLGFQHLDYVRYMRNWASAAHPNHNQITGLQLISMLETCIIEVITLPLSNVVVEIKKLLANIKTNQISKKDAKQIASFFIDLSVEQINTLTAGLFGIYTRLNSTTQTRQNVRFIIPFLWDRLNEDTRSQFGTKYARFVANNDQFQANLASEFLETVSGQSYIPDNIRSVEIQTSIENLLTVHREINNFYNEPTFARQLQILVGEMGKIPPQVNREYVYMFSRSIFNQWKWCCLGC
uniref:hypothetical protein n=1 Tax=Okeania sp. SIO2F4 TaxID=2607790 RepID=UPI0025E29F5F|nr:hypothetical protein [Okeania sp. SIO2F4]